MRLACRLREVRGRRKLTEVARAAVAAGAHGVTAAELSKIERGQLLPRDQWLDGLEAAYGLPRVHWYSRQALLAIQEDEEE